MMQPNQGPIPFPSLEARKAEALDHIHQLEAAIAAHRAMADLAGTAQWPQIERALSNQVVALIAKLLVERDHENIVRLQSTINVLKSILDEPEKRKKQIEACSKEVEKLRKEMEQ